jgi:hypothetical protein
MWLALDFSHTSDTLRFQPYRRVHATVPRCLLVLPLHKLCTVYTNVHMYIMCTYNVLQVRKDLPDKSTVNRELVMETDILLRLNHPNIVRLIGAGAQVSFRS